VAARYGMENVLAVMSDFFQEANERNKFGDTALIESARSGNIKAVELILKYKPSVPAANYYGHTAVSQARFDNFTDIARLLESFGAENPAASKELLQATQEKNLMKAMGAVNRGANVNVVDEKGYSPLSYAVELADKLMIEYLRSKGALNALASRRLVLAIRTANGDVFRKSLNEYADVNYTDKDLQTPLLIAAAFGNYEMLKELLERGAQVNARDKDGYSAVFYAAQENRVRIFDELIKYKADIKRKNNFGYTPLILASVEMVRRLVNAGVDVNATADNGGTAAYWAAIKDYDEVVKILVGAGAVDPKNNKELVMAARSNDVARAERALESNINIDLKNEEGYTALMYAVNSGANDVAKFLLDRKARVNLQDRDGYTPLMIALFRGDASMVDMLMQYRPDVNLRHRSGRTALIMATWRGNTEMMALVLKAGARVNDQDLDGWTALMFAAHEGNMAKVDLLIKSRALAKIKNKKGLMAEDLAHARHAEDVAAFLASRKA
ncbi:MAG TPA: ankyrin repeat domain-containing protein, partial [Turneriella sp.]|nr:ankyrin repeat domain-containing protein [Turneriella sp.]